VGIRKTVRSLGDEIVSARSSLQADLHLN
jgi:hypothetical protein